MKNKLIRTLLFAVVLITAVGPSSVYAVGDDITTGDSSSSIGICTFIKPICDALGIQANPDQAKEGVISFTTERIGQVVSLIFIGIIIISVFIIVQAGVKYIQSQGDEGKIEESQKAIRSVFIGIAILFVGIIGIVLVLAFFNGTGLLGAGGSVDDIFNPNPTTDS